MLHLIIKSESWSNLPVFVVVGLGIFDVENAVDIWPRVSIDTDVELISNAAPETIIRTVVLTIHMCECYNLPVCMVVV